MPADRLEPRYEPLIDSKFVGSLLSNQSLTTNIFSCEALLEIRDTVPCVLKRSVRKILFRLKIWGKHHGCNSWSVCAFSMSPSSTIQIRITPRPIKWMKTDVHITNLVYPEQQPDDLSYHSSTTSIPVLITKCTPCPTDSVKPPPPTICSVQSTPPQCTKMFHMCLLNVRSFGDDKKAGRVKDFVEQEHLDGAVFTETKSDNTSAHQIGDITLTGFNFYHCPRCGRKGV